MLLVLLANDVGRDAVKDRALAVRELDVVPADNHTATRAPSLWWCPIRRTVATAP